MKETGTYHNIEQVILISDGNQEFVETLVETFVTEMEKLLLRMGAAIEQGNQMEFGNTAHSMKPSLQMFGVAAVEEDIIWLERYGRAETASKEESAVRFAHVKEVLTTVLKEIVE